MVDRDATRMRIKASPFKMVGWARHAELNPGTVHQFLWGRLSDKSPMGQKIIEALRADGLLVEKTEEEAA